MARAWDRARWTLWALWALLWAWGMLAWSFEGRGLAGLVYLPFAIGGWFIALGIAAAILFPRRFNPWRSKTPRTRTSPRPR